MKLFEVPYIDDLEFAIQDVIATFEELSCPTQPYHEFFTNRRLCIHLFKV